MKKIISLLIALIFVTTAFVACNEPSAPAEKDYTLSIGVVVTENLASAKVDETVATIVTDSDGKIVLCRLDCVSYTASFVDGELDTTAPVSKVVLGDAYGSMPAGSWDKQTAKLEQFVVGKTKAEVAAITLNEQGKTDLVAGCTFNITDLIKAIDKAFASEYKTSFKSTATAFTAGLNASATVSAPDTETADATLTIDFASAVLADGKVVAAILDSTEATLNNITDDGAESFTFLGTKRERGTGYDSYAPMPAGTWYVQADAYAKIAVGKTAADIDGIATEGVAGCTMFNSPKIFKAGISAAVKGAR